MAFSKYTRRFNGPRQAEEACLLAWRKGLFVRWVPDTNHLNFMGGEQEVREMREACEAPEEELFSTPEAEATDE
jgi:hypothetical protein